MEASATTAPAADRPQPVDPPSPKPKATWYSPFPIKSALLLLPSVTILTLLYLSSSSLDTPRSSFSLIEIALPSDTYQLALASVGGASVAPAPDDDLIRRKEIPIPGTAVSEVSGAFLSLTAWGWCVGDSQTSTCSAPSLFGTLREALATSTDEILNPENYSRILLHMLTLHVLASVASVISLGFVCWYLWKYRQRPDGSVSPLPRPPDFGIIDAQIRPGWLQYGALLGTAVLATTAPTSYCTAPSATAFPPLRCNTGKSPSPCPLHLAPADKSSTGVILTGIAAILSWLTLLIWAGPSLHRAIRDYFKRQRQFVGAYGQQFGVLDELGRAESGGYGGLDDDEDGAEKSAVPVKEDKRKKKRRWYSRDRKPSRSRAEDRRRNERRERERDRYRRPKLSERDRYYRSRRRY